MLAGTRKVPKRAYQGPPDSRIDGMYCTLSAATAAVGSYLTALETLNQREIRAIIREVCK